MPEAQDEPHLDITTQHGNFTVPDTRVTLPKHVDFHMILESELDQLGKTETGFIGSLGFTFLGAMLGLLPTSIQTIKAFNDGNQITITLVDFISTCMCVASVIGAILCLTIYYINTGSNKSLVNKIKDREKQNMSYMNKH